MVINTTGTRIRVELIHGFMSNMDTRIDDKGYDFYSICVALYSDLQNSIQEQLGPIGERIF